MNIRFLEKDTKRVSLAFRLTDSFNSSAVITSGVEVYLEGVVQRPLHTWEGYIIYMDLPEGEYNVVASGKYYDFFDPLAIDTSTYNPLAGVIAISMRPKVDYPFPDTATLLRGIVKDQAGNPVSGARVEMADESDYAITDSLGRFVFYFEPENPTMDIALIVSAQGYQAETLSTTVVQGDTVFLNTTIVALSAPNLALISGFVQNTTGAPVTQARVQIDGSDISTLTDAHGNCILAKSLSSSSESLTIRINQDGYQEKVVTHNALAGQTTNFTATMNLQILPQTCTLVVFAEEWHHHKLGDVLVEVAEKYRSGYTNSSHGSVTFYENSILEGGESVTLRLSKPGYVTRVETVTLYGGHQTWVTYNMTSS